LNFCLFFIFRYCQHCLIGGVVDAGEKFISGVVKTDEQFFGGVVDTSDKFRLFGYF
jgi:hypothetical protein